MKKKFIAVYALIGVLALGSTALTSCVDDNESASVTAIRDAKAQQLAAIAALDNAKATYEEAMAKLKDAEAENQLLENDGYAAEIEKLKATYEQEKQKAEQTLITQLQGHQKTLYKNYADAQGEVVEITGQIVNKELQIASVKADTAELKAVVAEQIHTQEMTIAQETATKEAYQAMGNNSYDELVKQREQLNIEKENLSNEKTAKENAKTAADLAFDNAKAQKVDGGIVKSDATSTESTTVETPLKTVEAINILNDMASDEIADPDGSYDKVISMSVVKDGEKIKASEDADYSTYAYTLQVLNAPAVTVVTNELQDEIDAAKEAKGEEKDKAATPINGTSATEDDYSTIVFDSDATAYAKLNYFKKAAEDAKKDLEDAQDALEEAEEAETGVETAQAAVTKAEAAVRKANENLGFANDQILAAADEVIKDAEDLKAEFDAAVALLDENSADYKAYKAAVEALINTEGKAYVAADEEYKAAQLAYVTAVGEYNAVVDLVGNGIKDDPNEEGTVIDINAKIAECDKNIAVANAKIEKYENLLYTLTSSTPGGSNYNNTYTDSMQEVLAELEAELQDLNDKLAIAEQAEASWKAQLEASLNGTAAPAPETPAEGEETPAA